MKKSIIFTVLCASILFSQEGKKEKVSFAKEVLPILTKKCLGCHNTDDGSPSLLYFDDYKEMMSGSSKHGPVIIPKKGEESTLIKKLRGTADFGKQMPRGKKPLDEETISIICRWIDQGAKNN
ncbi:MAG: hypothetical protein PHP42_09005 [Bacteroidota bacterium]|nr:hypothetical protein [Bacteroidota bacterium]